MAERTQINFRIDNTLLAAIKEKCDRDNITQTDFITNALKAALGLPTINYTPSIPTGDSLESLTTRIAELEKRLADGIDTLSTEIDKRIATLIDNQLSTKLDERLAESQVVIADNLDSEIDKRIEAAIAKQMEESLGEYAA